MGGGGKKSNPSKKDNFFLINSAKIYHHYLYLLPITLPTRPSAYNPKHPSRRLARITFTAANHTVQEQSDDANPNNHTTTILTKKTSHSPISQAQLITRKTHLSCQVLNESSFGPKENSISSISSLFSSRHDRRKNTVL